MCRLARAAFFPPLKNQLKEMRWRIVKSKRIVLLSITMAMLFSVRSYCAQTEEAISALAKEVANKGWIAYSARAENGSWDVFISRPDGSQRRNITNTPDGEEAAPLFSWDGKRVLYRRLAKGSEINHDLWGFLGVLVISDADGKNPTVIGKDKEYTWGCWSPDGKQISCLTRKEIQIIDLATKQVVRTLPRQGIYQQLYWSQDGKWFTGTANHGGAQWCVIRMNAETGEVNPLITFQSCTPDWFPDSKRIIFSSRPKQTTNKGYGWTQIYAIDGDGKNLNLLFGEDSQHVYSASVSPDCNYVLFTKCPNDGGGSEKSGAPIFLMRMADAPIIQGDTPEIRQKYPKSNDGPVLDLKVNGWEPCWTFAEIGE